MPKAPHWGVNWDALDRRFEWIRQMRGVEQDPIWHAEGDVWIHTRMVCQALADMQAWRELDQRARLLCWLGVLFHDIAKPTCSQLIDGRIRSFHHSPRGAVHTRRLLWEAGMNPTEREQVCALVRHHQLPIHVLNDSGSELRVSAASMRCCLYHLGLVAEADMRGRLCEDLDKKLDAITLFTEYARELNCLVQPRSFPSEHTRYLFFAGRRATIDETFDDTRSTAILMSGLPGAGKSYWCENQRPDVPVVSMDAIRRELRCNPGDNDGTVRRAALEQARRYLRARQNFVWDATNLTFDRRNKLISLFRSYHARVEIVAVDAQHQTLWRQNAQRQHSVPKKVIHAMLRQWEFPDATEGHALFRMEYP